MKRGFWLDKAGNYAMMTAVLMVPLLGGLALGIDYSEMTRQRQITLNALDAAGIATARRAAEGADDAELLVYAKEFFEANLGSLDPSLATLHVQLPSQMAGGDTLKMSASMRYEPYFVPAFISDQSEKTLRFSATSEVRLKNTLEIALVLDNSGSMDILGTGSGRPRMELLKEAATQLVETIAKQGTQMKQLAEPVRFSVVPFAASVNVGPQNAEQPWMDRDGRSPIHHENFDWSTMPAGLEVGISGGIHRKQGAGWGEGQGQKITRFTLFDELRREVGTETVEKQVWGCVRYRTNGTCRQEGWVTETEQVPVYGSYTSWAGCVETRPGNFAYDVTPPNSQNPATYFVPMFAPDETDRRDSWNRAARNNWWDDDTTSTNDAHRQRRMGKYFKPAPLGTAKAGLNQGPNDMCSTTPITPLTDVTTPQGLQKVKNAINAMHALGGTDIPEATAWGWRTVTSTQPFTQARPEHERGNDKVVIVLTDGFNTYYTPNSLGNNDLANNRSIYDNQGYTGVNYNGGPRTRLFMNTSVNPGTHTNANFTLAMNQHLNGVCENMKASGVIVMTVALDLSSSIANERDAIEAMRKCASDSRFRRDPDDPTKPAKLFWNADGSNLADKFRAIADELSNLRIVG